MQDYSVVLFHSSSSALRMEKLCRERNIAVKLMPVPRHLSSDCGISLRFLSSETGHVDSLLKTHRVEFESIKKL